MTEAPQNFANHRKFVPGYHFVAFGILVINAIWSLYRLFQGVPGVPIFDRVLAVLVAIALLMVTLYARIFPLKAQDRVIRLEERSRLQQLLPADLVPRIGELRGAQLIALRFASDAELPELTRTVLDKGIRDTNEIKKMIRDWRPDHFRL